MRATFFGLLTIDLQFFINSYPLENTKVKAAKFDIGIGGPATNAAVTFAFLGGNPKLISPVGQSSFVPLLKQEFKQFRINFFDPIDSIERLPVFAAVATSMDNGARTIISYNPEPVSVQLLDLSRQELLLVDGFYLDQAIEAAKTAKINNIPVVLDGGSWKNGMERLLPLIDIAICSEHFNIPSAHSSLATIYGLYEAGIRKIAITRGGKSILVKEADHPIFELEVPQIQVVDTLGAGDIFHGAFCYYYLKQEGFLESLSAAARIAAHSCKFSGTRSWMKDPESTPSY